MQSIASTPFFFEDSGSVEMVTTDSRLSEAERSLVCEMLQTNGLVQNNVVNFVGFLGLKGSSKQLFFLPKTIRERFGNNEEALVSLAATSLRVLEKFSQERARHNEGFDAMEEEAIILGIDLLRAAIDLLRDWQENGYLSYVLQERAWGYENKITWSATIAQTVPFVVNEDVIYQEPVGTRTSSSEQMLISNIHRSCVENAFRIAGWLPEFRGISPEHSQIQNVWSVSSVGDKIALLTDALDHEFAESRIRTLKLIVAALDSKQAIERGIICGTKSFHVIWQEMCSVLLANEWNSSFREKISQPKLYKSHSGKRETEVPNRIRQIPDIVYKDAQDILHCIDAKYYDVRAGFPDWSDFAKQFIYGDSIEKEFPGKIIFNAFLFPLPETSERLPHKLVLERTSLNRTIHLKFVDIVSVMDDYCESEKLGVARLRLLVNA
jgi:hypothetical protein